MQKDLSVLYFADGDFDNAERLQAEAVALCPGQEIDSQMLLTANISEARLVEQLKAVASEGDVVIGLGATLSDTVKLAASAVPSFISDDNHNFVYLHGDKVDLDELVILAPQERNLWAALWFEGDPDILKKAGLLLYDVGNSLYLVQDQDAKGTITLQLVALRETVAEQEIPVATLCMLDQQIAFAYAESGQFDVFVEKLDQLISECVNAQPTSPVLGLIGRETYLALRQIFTHLLEEGDLESASKVAVRLLTFENSQQDVPDLPEFVQPLIDGQIDEARRLAYDLLVIDAKNPDALGLLTAVNLMERFEQANAVTYTQDAPEPVNIRRFVMPHNGDWGNVIFTHPPVALSFALNLPEKPVALQTRVALDPQSWGWGGDGVTFIVTIQEDGALPVELYRTLVTNDDSGHDWRPVLVSLAGYAGKEVVLTLAAASGPSGDSTGDWAGWESPRLVWELMD